MRAHDHRRRGAQRRTAVVHTWLPLLLFVLSLIAPLGCSCGPDPLPAVPQGILPCRPRPPAGPPRPGAPPPAPRTTTVAAGSIAASFALSPFGEAMYTMPLVAVPGRAGVEPALALAYHSAGFDGVLGMGFSLAGLSAIARCPSNLADDGEIRAVRDDAEDKLCLDGKRLVPVGSAAGTVEYRTLPDTRVKVIGHFPSGEDAKEGALFFEVFTPSGLIVEYGSGEGGKPLVLGGAPRAWLAQKAHDGRGNAMTYTYCFADAEGYTAEYALDEIRYTSFEGANAIAPSRAVKLVYGTKDPADVRTLYSDGMALQSSLRLDEIQMLGPGDALVRRYGFAYDLGPTTKRTRLTQVEECGSDKVCKPPTRFQYSGSAAGFKKLTTSLPAPISARASPMLLDVDGDGLDDLVLPDTNAALSTPVNPITDWSVARNHGASASPPYLAKTALGLSEDWPTVAQPSGPADPRQIQPELGTALDYDQDGRTDIFLHDVYGSSANWIVLLAQPDRTFKAHDTGITRPFPLGASPPPPRLTTRGASVHLADLDGDGVPDLIQCQDHSTSEVLDPTGAAWTVHRWQPAQAGLDAGFASEGERAEALDGYPCDTEFYTLDINGDGKIDLLVDEMVTFEGTKKVPASTYRALTRLADGTFEGFDTKLPIVAPGGRVLFLDVNGDGLPDAVETSFGDHLLYTYMNTGRGFEAAPVKSLAWDGIGEQDRYLGLAAPLDYNGDGRQDLLMPLPPGMLPGGSDALPSWAVLLATGAREGPTFLLIDPHIPFEAALGETIELADPHGPRIGDLNGDGAPDVVLPLGGVFNLFENVAPDQDLLVGVADGMSAHEEADPGFVPSVRISYGHLTDASITEGKAAEDTLYRSHSDTTNDCAYPRACAVGPRRVVSAYALNNGADGLRSFDVRYRDGRYHRLGRGFLGFGARIVTDRDTRAGTADLYDNATFRDDLRVFPFAGQIAHTWRWLPGLPDQPQPERIELAFTDLKRTVVPTSDGATYFTLPTERRVRRLQGTYLPANGSVEADLSYVREVEAKGSATLLRDSVTKVTSFDAFGNLLGEDVSTSGVDLSLHVERSFKNDTARWILGQRTSQKECSAAAMLSACRTLTLTPTIYGEVATAVTSSDDGSPDTQLTLTYGRDDFGNVTSVTADDAYGHHRVSTTTYDPEGIYPERLVNAAGHETLTAFDAAFGVLARLTDPNKLVTERRFDSLGRLGFEARPDGTETTIALSRSKDGGAAHDAWRVLQRSTTTGGADDTVELDSLGRPIRRFWHGPAPEGAAGERPRVMQEIAYDVLGEHIARRSVPAREDTPEGELLYDTYAYDAAGREVRHETPWGASIETAYEGLLVRGTDAGGYPTVTELDALGRPVVVTDAEKGLTSYSYGPFGWLATVTDPGGALTRFTRDALGRVRQLDDPDRGTTISAHDGFGELISSTDALGRVTTWEYDALGRTHTRLDQEGGQSLTTTWTWDKAEHGKGQLQALASPDGVKTYTYTSRGQLETLTLAIAGEGDALTAKLAYDSGHVTSITYPTPAGAAPFVVAQDYDRYGHVLKVRDSATSLPYWRLTDVDEAGRYHAEAFGNDVTTERSYHADQQILMSLVTKRGTKLLQGLAYTYDARLNLASRTDALQKAPVTERFRYDGLERLKCTYFGAIEDPAAPCALSYDYKPDGNLSFKSDVGVLAYDDPLHPHAVTSAGGDSFAYDAVGNQFARPGAALTYTAFDLPKTIEQSTGPVTFGYDGDEQRIRKTTPLEETLYFEGLYERVTASGTPTEHRYYIRSPERVVAVVTRGGKEPGTRYVHVDHLGSVDVLTDVSGAVVERRSYDPFGQRRSPIWGQPTPASFESKTTLGFTGHESDSDLGLVNMKGRIFDPRVGRFLTTDPIVSRPLSGQSWNAYSYVANNPLSYVDPSGFAPGYVEPPVDPAYLNNPEVQRILAQGCMGLECVPRPTEQVEGPSEAAQSGASAPPVDVSTTGSGAGYVAEPQATAPSDWIEHPDVQFFGGYLGGVLLGQVPFAGVGQQVLDAANVLPHGTPDARLGLALGQIVSGILLTTGGFTGEVLGGAASVTGIGAALGVPAMVVSTGLVVGGAANIAAGIRGLSQTLLSEGSGSTGPQGTASGAGEEAQTAESVNPNKLHHVFGRTKHKLGPLVEKFGSQEATFREVERAAQAAVRSQGISGVFETTVEVGGSNVVVRGTVMNGVVRVGSFWSP